MATARGTVRIYQAIKANGEALWPEQRSLEWIQQQRDTTPGPFFNAQYMNDPSGLEGVLYSLGWLNFFTADELPPLNTLIGMIGADPATSESKAADYFGTCTVGKDPRTGLVYILGFAFDNIPSPQHEGFLRIQYQRWQNAGLNIRLVRKESHGPIQAATQHLMLSNRQRKDPLPLEIVKPQGSKRDRFDELIPHMGNGTLLFPGERRPGSLDLEMVRNTGFEEFVREFSSFDIGKRDDLLDALWVAVDGLMGSTPAAAVSDSARPRSNDEFEKLMYSMGGEEFVRLVHEQLDKGGEEVVESEVDWTWEERSAPSKAPSLRWSERAQSGSGREHSWDSTRYKR